MIFTGNAAERGGELSLEINAKLYILKYGHLLIWDPLYADTVIFTANGADYGGAVYTDDDTNSGTCASDTKTECFFQVLALYVNEADSNIKTQSMHFSQNSANISGSTLYGGLLDRCAVSQFAEVHNKHSLYEQNYEYKGNGESYFKDISIGENILIIIFSTSPGVLLH